MLWVLPHVLLLDTCLHLQPEALPSLSRLVIGDMPCDGFGLKSLSPCPETSHSVQCGDLPRVTQMVCARLPSPQPGLSLTPLTPPPHNTSFITGNFGKYRKSLYSSLLIVKVGKWSNLQSLCRDRKPREGKKFGQGHTVSPQ